VSEWAWRRLPPSLAGVRPVIAYGRLMHTLARHGDRRQYLGTFFLRNRPELELIARLAGGADRARPARIAVLGCSIGTEVYSVVWTVRSRHPGANIVVQASDISEEALAVAREGVYPRGVCDLVSEPVCALMTEDEMRAMFDAQGDVVRVKPGIRDGIVFREADAGDPRLPDVLGVQDIVVANRFLCHMTPVEAERCLRNIARLVAPGGHLFVSGIDLDVRTKVARELGWTPVPDLMEEIHDGDRTLRSSWPWKYWGLEPLDRERSDWSLRYAAVFQVA